MQVLKSILYILFAGALCAQNERDANKKLIENFIENIFNERELNQISDYVTPDYIEHSNGVTTSSVASLIKTVKFLEETADDFHLEIEQILAEQDNVMVLWNYQGFNKEYQKKVALSGVFIARIADDKIVEGWQIFDNFTRLKQLGFEVIAPPDSLAP